MPITGWTSGRLLVFLFTGAGVLCAFFCAANAVDTPGTKNSALCCFLNVPFKSLISGK